jgi:hypothetical protein
MRISTAYGVLTLEAKWLVPPGTLPEDAARDPKSCFIAVTTAFHEHPIAYAARVLRENGATPAQTKVEMRTIKVIGQRATSNEPFTTGSTCAIANGSN